MYLLRPLDVSEALTHLLAQEEADELGPLSALINPERVVVAGHSFGGYTTFALAGARFDTAGLEARCAEISDAFCAHFEVLKPLFEAGSQDPRVKLALPQSSGNLPMFGVEGLRGVSIPTLHISAARDQDCTEEAQNAPYWEGLSTSSEAVGPLHRWLSFKEAGHASLTVSCAQFPGLELDNGCGEDFTPPTELHDLMNRYALSFVRAHLTDDQEALELINNSHDDERLTLTLPSLSE
jgi:predicted dienelactone hydrolase